MNENERKTMHTITEYMSVLNPCGQEQYTNQTYPETLQKNKKIKKERHDDDDGGDDDR